MSRSTQTGVVSPARSWTVRPAGAADTDAVVVAAQELLLELGSTPPPRPALQRAVHELICDRDAGVVLLACVGSETIGMLAASWPLAIHATGRYALIQDLWVQSSWRSRSIGAELIAALVDLVHERGLARIEVGLPRESFHSIAATEAFYLANDFAPLGPRMRRLLP
jgi:GNAT superfamily N-acetyltransferase